jgi:hypothetical protein
MPLLMIACERISRSSLTRWATAIEQKITITASLIKPLLIVVITQITEKVSPTYRRYLTDSSRLTF